MNTAFRLNYVFYTLIMESAFSMQSTVCTVSTWSCCMPVWCPHAWSPQCLLLFERCCVSPVRRPGPRLMSPRRTPERSHSLFLHQHWHGSGSEPLSWTHPRRYCHLWTYLWAHVELVFLTAGAKQRESRVDFVWTSGCTAVTTLARKAFVTLDTVTSHTKLCYYTIRDAMFTQ